MSDDNSAAVVVIVPKIAMPGTMMYRRSDVRGAIKKLVAYAIRNKDLAEAEGRLVDAEVQRVRLRTLNTVQNELFGELPTFINAQEVEGRLPDIGIPTSLEAA